MGNLLLRRRMMMAQGGVSLPAGYTKIEYLESDGNSYIDTGFKPNQDTRVVMDFQLADTSAAAAAIFGGRSSYTVQDFSFWLYNGGWLTNFGTTSTSIQSDVTGRYVVDKNKLETKINGKSVNSITAAFQSPVNLFIFAVKEETGIDERLGKMRLYSCQIYDNGALVRDFIPCTNPDGISGLWDSVNDVFYKLLPADYTKLDFIETDGTTYIDTGFKPNQDTRVVMDVHLLSTTTGDGYPMAFGVYTDNSNRFSSFWNASKWQVWFGNYGSTTSSPNIERVKIDLSKDQYIVGDVSLPVSSASFTSNRTLYLLAMNQGDVYYVSQARLYSCQIYDNGILVRDFIPAMNASGEAGLYDLKNDVWYALKPVVTKKENKISPWVESGNVVRYGVESQYPLASDVTVLYEGEERGAGEIYRYADSKVMSKGIQKTTAWELVRFIFGDTPITEGRTISAIRSISPTEDDTYIYTF